MPMPLVVSSTIGAESGAPIIIAASGPSILPSSGNCSSHCVTAMIAAVLSGSAIVVAMSPPHRNAAA